MLRTGQLFHLASHLASRPRTEASLPGALAPPRTGLPPAGCRELVARLRHILLSPWRPNCWTHVGCFKTIRNIVTHSTIQPEEQLALEQLAALSVLARWIEEAMVVRWSDTSPPGT